MSRGLNKVMLIGHVGRPPEMRYTPSGRAVTTFSVVTSRSWNTANGERRTESDSFPVVAWGNLAEICHQLLHKGQQVYIEGRLKNHRWEDNDGNSHLRTEVVANEMIILGERKQHFQADQNGASEEVSESEAEGAPSGESQSESELSI